jgi:hypothetical protein
VIELYRNEYHTQSQGNELIMPGLEIAHLFDAGLFSPRSSATVLISRDGSPPLKANSLQLRDQGGRIWSAIYTYEVDDLTLVSSRRVHLETALRAMYSRPTAGVLAVATPCVPDCEAVKADLEFVAVQAHAAYGTSSIRKQP